VKGEEAKKGLMEQVSEKLIACIQLFMLLLADNE
jgi:hypothetical protein